MGRAPPPALCLSTLRTSGCVAMRLADLDEATLDPAGRAVLDSIRHGPRGAAVGLEGPFGVWVRAPAVGAATQALGSTIRYGTTLTAGVREVAICTVGAYYRARFEFAAHARLALAAGVAPAAVERLRLGQAPQLEGAQDLAWRVARALLDTHRLDHRLYAEAQACFGDTALIELVTTIGYYCLVALTLNAFEIPLTPDLEDPFPDP